MSPATDDEETTVMAWGHGQDGLQSSDRGGVSPGVCVQVARGQPQAYLFSSMTQVLKGWQPVNSSVTWMVYCSHPLSLAVAASYQMVMERLRNDSIMVVKKRPIDFLGRLHFSNYRHAIKSKIIVGSANCRGSKRGFIMVMSWIKQGAQRASVSQGSGQLVCSHWVLWLLLFRGTGMMVKALKQLTEVFKMSLSPGARWSAQCFTLEGETESGPAAWRDIRL